MNIPISEYRRMAREAMKGRLLYLTLISAFCALPGLGWFDSRARLLPWMIAAMAALQLLSALLNYGQEHIFLLRFRDEPESPALLFQFKMFPKLAAIFLLRDALPTLLLEAGAHMPMGTYQQFSRASTLQLAGLIANAVMLYNYGMAEYMLINDPALTPIAAMRQSRRTLSGNRIRLILLSLSFFGWMLLARVPDLMLVELAPGLPSIASSLISLLWTAPLLTYVHMAQTAFFEVIAGRKQVELPDTQWPPQPPAPVEVRAPGPPLSADEAAAYDMLSRYAFSRRRMQADGELDAYLSLNIPPEKEALWRRDWLDSLLRDYQKEPDGMDDALACAAEYADVPALRQAAQTLDDGLTSGQVIEGMIARQTLALARILSVGDFDPAAPWLTDTRTAIGDLANRLETRLTKLDPNGPWQATLQEIRAQIS